MKHHADATEPEAPGPFDLHGTFGGIFRDIFGKRRMALRVEGEELYLKVPKALRRQLEGKLIAGQEISVRGEQEAWGRGVRVVAQVRSAGREVCVSCPIRVCTKKNCWRSGGKELWAALEREIATAGLTDAVKLEGVDCLDHCKRGPNAECAGHNYHHCTPNSLAAILTPFVE